MEFKLNKIDTDIRKKMQEEIKEDKVHSGKGINIKKDLKEEKKDYIQEEKVKEIEKKFITIDGMKYSNRNMDVRVEKIENLNEENSKGRILDRTK